MNYSVEILLEQKTLLEEEMRFAEGIEIEETKQRYVDVCTALNKLNLPDVSITLSGFMDWLWLNHNILTNADNNKIALEKYLATL